jgi:CRP-like cAMP-binding protein
VVDAGGWIEAHPFVLRLRHFAPDLDFSEAVKLWDAVEEDLRIPARRDIVIQGWTSTKCWVVESGFAMRYHLLHDGRRQVLSIVTPGDVFGLAETALEAAPRSVCSLSETKIQRFNRQRFFEICSLSPRLSMAIMCFLVHQLGLYYERLTELGRQSPLERVAHFLLRFHSRVLAVGCASESVFDLPLSQEIIGDLLGLSGPHVNRMFHRLRSEGLIRTYRRRIEFVDIEGLHRLSGLAPPTSSVATAANPA